LPEVLLLASFLYFRSRTVNCSYAMCTLDTNVDRTVSGLEVELHPDEAWPMSEDLPQCGGRSSDDNAATALTVVGLATGTASVS